MTIKELLIQEIETLPPELFAQALNLIRAIKTSHTEKQLQQHPQSNKDDLHSSTAQDLLEFAGTWEGDDIRECLELVDETVNSKAKFWDNLEKFRRKENLETAGIEPEIFADLRDNSPGREVNW